jgi:hypothetical protein
LWDDSSDEAGSPNEPGGLTGFDSELDPQPEPKRTNVINRQKAAKVRGMKISGE